jgi:hypothetical protein
MNIIWSWFERLKENGHSEDQDISVDNNNIDYREKG